VRQLVGSLFLGYRCTSCSKAFPLGPISLSCPICGKGIVEAAYDHSNFVGSEFQAGVPSVWKYHQLLPLNLAGVTLEEGGTPLHRCGRLFGLKHLFVKDESRNPTSSFADRGSTVAVSVAVRLGARRVACATDGDTGASVAAYASKAGLECMIFAPESAEAGKLLQTLVYGAKVFRTRGSFRNAIMRCASACRASDRQDLTIETNPSALEGEKTTGFEIADQLSWTVPDFVVIPVGTGTNLYAIWKGFKELHRSGMILDMPRMVATQAAACAPIALAFQTGEPIRTLGPTKTIAPSIAIGDPINGEAALPAIRESKGLAYSIRDDDMIEAVNLLGSREGIFAEPASAATICAARILVDDGTADASDSIVCVVTGSGLKVPDSIARTLKPRLSTAWDLVNMDQKTLGPLGPTKIHILEVLQASPTYGYSIWRELNVRFSEAISLQAVYQHLNELRSMGLLGTRERGPPGRGRRRKYFALSSRGRRIIASLDAIRDSLLPMETGPGNR